MMMQNVLLLIVSWTGHNCWSSSWHRGRGPVRNPPFPGHPQGRIFNSPSTPSLIATPLFQKCGIAIFVLYIVQLTFGFAVHFLRPKASSSRPLQNYLHAVIGLLLVALAFYQVRLGCTVEWPKQTGRGPVPNAANIMWYIWVVVSAI